jgi:sucrose-6-phosphate hydrolase SacC (GH32 family)
MASSQSSTSVHVGKLGPDTSVSERAFSAHRPVFHLLPLRNWLNDPCAPCMDKDGTYHLFFQYTAEVNDWSKIQWGYAESRNLLDWRVGKDSVLVPGDALSADKEGVFTGCMMSVPKGITKRLVGEDGMTGECELNDLIRTQHHHVTIS